MKTLRLLNFILLPSTFFLLFGCAFLEKNQPYFVAAASIGTSEYLASLPLAERPQAAATIQEIGTVIATLSSGQLLTPAQFATELQARVPKSATATHIENVAIGIYSVMYADLKDQPGLKQDWINALANAILAAAH